MFQADRGTWGLLDERFENRIRLIENVPFGVIDCTDYVHFSVRLKPGDIVIMDTDALNDSRDAAGEELGEEGLLDLVRNLERDDLSTLTQRIIDGTAAFRGNVPVDDDQTVFVLHHNAANPPRQSIADKMKVMAKVVGLIRVRNLS
jgi:hypothetical protein